MTGGGRGAAGRAHPAVDGADGARRVCQVVPAWCQHACAGYLVPLSALAPQLVYYWFER
jgi:hypothetical protein